MVLAWSHLVSRSEVVESLRKQNEYKAVVLQQCRESLDQLSTMPPEAVFYGQSAREYGNLERYDCSRAALDDVRVLCVMADGGTERRCYVTLRVGAAPSVGKGSTDLLARTPLLPDAPVTRLLRRLGRGGEMEIVQQGEHLVRYDTHSHRFEPADSGSYAVVSRRAVEQILRERAAEAAAAAEAMTAELQKWTALPDGLYDRDGRPAAPVSEVRAVIGNTGDDFAEVILRTGQKPQVLRRIGTKNLPGWLMGPQEQLLRVGPGVFTRVVQAGEVIWTPIGLIVGE